MKEVGVLTMFTSKWRAPIRLAGFVTVFGLLIAGGACAAPPPESTPEAPAEPLPNEVIVMGMIHGDHEASELYGIERIREIVRAVDPDYILAEIPPDRWPIVQAELEAGGVITEPRVIRFPEYVKAILPMLGSSSFEVLPCAAWTRSMADERSAKLEDWKRSRPDDSARVDTATEQAEIAIANGHQADDPAWIHTPDYDQLVARGLAPYSELFGDDLGEGGWEQINAAHYRLIDQAIANHGKAGGKRFLITFGVWHKYWFLQALSQRDDLQLRSLQEFL
jgi:hypothetical protein